MSSPSSVIPVVRERLRAERQLAALRTGYVRSRRSLAGLAEGDRRIVAGPFVSEVGFECLYWVPLLRWFKEEHGVDPARITAFSRGGPVSWYEGIAGDYVDIFEHVDPGRLKQLRSERVAETRNEKQFGVAGFERELLRSAGLDGEHAVLHPSLMYEMFWAFWSLRRPVSRVLEHTRFSAFGRRETPRAREVLAELPEDYVAVKPYFSGCFPETEENRRFATGMLERLAASRHVVLLATGIDLDDHEDIRELTASGRIHLIDRFVTPSDNLEIQSAVVRKARALYTTYGGFAHLGPFLSVPTLAFYSQRAFNPAHLDVMGYAVDTLQQGRRAGFVLLHVADTPLLESFTDSLAETTR